MARRTVDWTQIKAAALGYLSREGPRASKDLRDHLRISHASLARMIKTLSTDVIAFGRGPATTYGVRRPVDEVPRDVPIYKYRHLPGFNN